MPTGSATASTTASTPRRPAIDAALRRGWTSISEQWVNQERLEELDALAADGALPLRVDAYLALNFGRSSSATGTPTASRARSMTASRPGLKIHLDNGWGTVINWEPAELTATIGRADEAGWQVSVHA